MRSHDDPNLIHPHERVSPDPAVEKDDRMGARGAQRWRDAWNQKTPHDGCGFNAKPLRTDVNRVVVDHMTSRHAG